jgi:hypothetical protein
MNEGRPGGRSLSIGALGWPVVHGNASGPQRLAAAPIRETKIQCLPRPSCSAT